MRTDDQGRLLVLGGRGRSACHPPDTALTTFINNDGWHDDIADGPVRATARFPDGRTIDAEPGYVAVTPPNYAPGLAGVMTMNDAVRETYIAQGWLTCPAATSFSADIWPIFKRLSDLQWVNHGFYMMHGHDGPLDVDADGVLDRLRDSSPTGADWRAAVLALFRREQDLASPDTGMLPQIYGDAEGEVVDAAHSACLAVTPTQFAHLTRWAAGDFADDWSGPAVLPDFAALGAREQIEQLERAALHDCLGGPFHPGIELTWTMRIPHLWAAVRPYSISERPLLTDPLAQIVDLLRPDLSYAKFVEGAGVWRVRRSEDGQAFFFAALQGKVRLEVGGHAPLLIEPGDVVLIPAAYDFASSSVGQAPASGHGELTERIDLPSCRR